MTFAWLPEPGENVYWTGEPCRIDGVVLALRWHMGRWEARVKWEDSTNQGIEWVGVGSLRSSDN